MLMFKAEETVPASLFMIPAVLMALLGLLLVGGAITAGVLTLIRHRRGRSEQKWPGLDPTFERLLFRVSGYALVVVCPLFFAGAMWVALLGYQLAWLTVIGTVVGIAYLRRANRSQTGEQVDTSRAG
jgi:hypothetical protein